MSSVYNTINLTTTDAQVVASQEDNIYLPVANESTYGVVKLGEELVVNDSGNLNINKVTEWSDTTSDIKFPTEKLVKDSLEEIEEKIDALTAEDIAYDNVTSGLSATNVQTAIDQVEGRVDTAESTITNHGTRINTAESNITNLQGRMNTAESTISDHGSDISNLKGRMNTVEGKVSTIESYIPTGTTSTNKLVNKGYIDPFIEDVGELQSNVSSLQTSVNEINSKIPTEASSLNKLADKAYVDEAVSQAGRAASYVFPNISMFELWLVRNYERPDGKTIDDLKVGAIVLIEQQGVPDYWCKSIQQDPWEHMSIENNFDEFEFELDLSDYQKKMQFDTLPTPTFEYYGKTVQYIGLTMLPSYKNSHFYKCVLSEEGDHVYSAVADGAYVTVASFDDTAGELENLPDGQTTFKYNVLTDAWTNNNILVDLADYGIVTGSTATASTIQYKPAGQLTINNLNASRFRELVNNVEGRYVFRIVYQLDTITVKLTDESELTLSFVTGGGSGDFWRWEWRDNVSGTTYFTKGEGWGGDKYIKSDMNLYDAQEGEVVGTVISFTPYYSSSSRGTLQYVNENSQIGYTDIGNNWYGSTVDIEPEDETENDYFVIVLGRYPADEDEIIITKERVDGYTWQEVEVQDVDVEVDQEYDATSTNAQSGTAVAQAVATAGVPIRRLGDE